MVVQHTRALVSYDDGRNVSQPEQVHTVALQCATALRRQGVNVEVRGYSDSALEADPQWLILIHASEIRPTSPMVDVVNTALNRVVARRMRDVLAITTTSSDLRPEWASIRKYDASNPGEENAALDDMLQAMESVKLPYNQALAQQRRGSAWNGRQKAPSVLRLALVVTTIVVGMLAIAGGVIFFLPGYLHPASTGTASTATADARARASATTLQASPGVSAAKQQAMQKSLNALTKGSPTVQGFQHAEAWSNPPAAATSSCTLNGNNTYTVNIHIPNQYNTCLAGKPALTDIVMQVTMSIQGDAGGIIFRSESTSKSYYRLAVNQSDATIPTIDTFSLIRCSGNCTGNSVASGTPLTNNMNTNVHVDRKKPITLTLIVRSNTFDVFINGQFVASITDTSYTHSWSGAIGVYAASLGKDTTVIFSDLKVWSLDKRPAVQPTQPPVIQPTVVG